MLEDIRGHDAHPTIEESEWIGANAVTLFMRAIALAGVSLVIGVSASVLIEGAQVMPEVVAARGAR